MNKIFSDLARFLTFVTIYDLIVVLAGIMLALLFITVFFSNLLTTLKEKNVLHCNLALVLFVTDDPIYDNSPFYVLGFIFILIAFAVAMLYLKPKKKGGRS